MTRYVAFKSYKFNSSPFQHYKLLSDRLQDLGSYFGALPVHNGRLDLINSIFCAPLHVDFRAIILPIQICILIMIEFPDFIKPRLVEMIFFGMYKMIEHPLVVSQGLMIS